LGTHQSRTYFCFLFFCNGYTNKKKHKFFPFLIYNEGATKIFHIGRDKLDLFDVAGILEVASLYCEEPELDAAFFNDDGEGNNLTFFS
jgi:hypothetical protein